MPVDSEFKEFGAKVPLAEYERFKEALPQYGSTQWFINTALKTFNDMLSQRPSLIEEIDKAVERMLAANRNPEAAAAMFGMSLEDALAELKRQAREGSDTVTSESTGAVGAKAR